MNEVVKQILNGKCVRQVIDEASCGSRLVDSFNKGSGKRLEFEDDLVRVFDPNGKEIYSGIEDYEPMKDEDWKFDSAKGLYVLPDGYQKEVI